MEALIEISSVPVIVALVYLIISLYKQFVVNSAEIYFKLIPIIAAVLGMILGVVAFYFAPDIIPASNILAALLIGGLSGLSATGANQIVKQFSKDKVINANDKTDDNNTTT